MANPASQAMLNEQDDPGVVAPRLGRIVDETTPAAPRAIARPATDRLRSLEDAEQEHGGEDAEERRERERDETPVDERLDRADHEDGRGA